MADRHLNLFFSYNRDTELLENNLTRAWIVTMRVLSCEAREQLLHLLLGEDLRARDDGSSKPDLTFATAQFALQSHMNPAVPRFCTHKYLVAIASEREQDDQVSAGLGPAERKNRPALRASGSIPDAWIFNRADSYCFLVEAKVGTNPLDDDQIANHWTHWFGSQGDELAGHLIALSWDDLANVLEAMLSNSTGRPFAITDQERKILEELREYLAFFGYRAFRGLTLNALKDAPALALGSHPVRVPEFARLNVPGFKLLH